ncbi:hypothetical protein pEpSNUABM08_03 [Erwinia phage pEp_SNUABM_08]|uniref:Uncharacterized protein n=1 Tax=Erwinia phage pEp_SNUABM_08 TaxID=2593268 RepID=A0A5J6DA76_9CAUD|nr:hypothetical protein JT353_gp03 [Erwinia phage pEp_SNUABM_08]QEQ94750.1 hypothetical protein pEpSNUABM08_03 [Erwinia phage pEp_SNUABM_08]
MSLEQVIAENNSLLRELIDLQKAGGASAKTTDAGTEKSDAKTTTTKGGAKGGKTTTTKAKAEVVDPDTLKAKLVEYKNLTDLKAAKALTKELGYDAIADVPDDKSKEVFDAIDAAILALDNGNTADADAEEDL